MSHALPSFRRIPLTLVAVAAGLGMGWAILTYRISSTSPPPLPSQAETPTQAKVTALGRLEPEGEVIQVNAPTLMEGARIQTLSVEHGQWIRQGDLIARLDTYPRRAAALFEAQAQERVANSQLRQVQAGAKVGQIQAQARVVDRLQAELQTEVAAQEATIAQLTAERDHAQREAQRYTALQTEGAVSASLRDSQRLGAETAQERLNAARANLDRIRLARLQQIAEAQATLAQIAEVRPVDVEVARAQVEQAQAGVMRAKADLELAEVLAPQTGQVLKIHSRPGEWVGDQGILSLGQTRRMVAVAEVYETDISRIQVGQDATVTSKNNAFPDVLKGTVVEVGLEINKQDVLNTDPAAQFDARVVEVKVLLDEASSQRVAGLTNLSIQVAIEVAKETP